MEIAWPSAVVATVAVIGVVVLAFLGKVDGAAAVAIVTAMLAQAGLRPAVARSSGQGTKQVDASGNGGEA